MDAQGSRPTVRRASVVAVAAALAVATAAPPLGSIAHASAAGPALTIDVTAGRHAISPDIYGESFANAATAKANGVTLDRFGGNSASRFNYKTNVTNTGADYFYENVASTPASKFVGADRGAGLRTVWQLPMSGYVSKKSPTTHPFLCGFPTSTFPSQDATDPFDSQCGNGLHNGVALTGADPSTTSVAEGPAWDKAEVAYLVSLYGKASAGGIPFYQLDNEPTLWNSTHRDIHPNAATYSEVVTKSKAAAAAVKAADPSAAVLGPSDWGWCAYFYSSADSCNIGADRKSHGNLDFVAYYLQQMKAYGKAHGKRVLDYFDEHYYPQDGVALAPAGNAAKQAQRLSQTRTLWDPSYKDDSWIGTDVGQNVYLIPRMRAWIKANYPGTKLSISEYNFGGLESLNGALTEADVLGIFAREQVDLATLWSPPTAKQPGAFAFRLFRNYDGHGAKFGDTYVRSASTDQGKLSVYAAQRSDGTVTAVVLNKSANKLTSKLALQHFTAAGTAQVWRYSGANLTHIVRQPNVKASASMSLSFPASSATVIVIGKAGPAANAAKASSPGATSLVDVPAGQSLPAATTRRRSAARPGQ